MDRSTFLPLTPSVETTTPLFSRTSRSLRPRHRTTTLMFVSSSCSKSLSLRFAPPCADLAGDDCLLGAIDGDFKCAVGVAVCAREGGGRIDPGRVVDLLDATPGREGADIIGSAFGCRVYWVYARAETHDIYVHVCVYSACLPMRRARSNVRSSATTLLSPCIWMECLAGTRHNDDPPHPTPASDNTASTHAIHSHRRSDTALIATLLIRRRQPPCPSPSIFADILHLLHNYLKHVYLALQHPATLDLAHDGPGAHDETSTLIQHSTYYPTTPHHTRYLSLHYLHTHHLVYRTSQIMHLTSLAVRPGQSLDFMRTLRPRLLPLYPSSRYTNAHVSQSWARRSMRYALSSSSSRGHIADSSLIILPRSPSTHLSLSICLITAFDYALTVLTSDYA